jgi:hypothetical protein
MITFTQLILSVVIVTLTFMMVAAGIQVFHILHEFRQIAKKINKILGNTEALSESASRPVAAVNSFFSEVRERVFATEDTLIAETADKVISPPHSQKAKPRFFKRSGTSLHS